MAGLPGRLDLPVVFLSRSIIPYECFWFERLRAPVLRIGRVLR